MRCNVTDEQFTSHNAMLADVKVPRGSSFRHVTWQRHPSIKHQLKWRHVEVVGVCTLQVRMWAAPSSQRRTRCLRPANLHVDTLVSLEIKYNARRPSEEPAASRCHVNGAGDATRRTADITLSYVSCSWYQESLTSATGIHTHTHTCSYHCIILHSSLRQCAPSVNTHVTNYSNEGYFRVKVHGSADSTEFKMKPVDGAIYHTDT